MSLEQRLAKLESDNTRLKFVACMAFVVLAGLLLWQLESYTPTLLAQEAKRRAQKPDELKATKLILVDPKGNERVALAADESAAAPTAPVFTVLDMKGKLVARIG